MRWRRRFGSRRPIAPISSASPSGLPGAKFEKETVPPHLVRMVADMNAPAYIIGARFDLLCWNQHAAALFRDYSKISRR